MSITSDRNELFTLLDIILRPLYIYNPFFSLYYNPLVEKPQPYATSKPYYNYIHQVSLVLDLIPRRSVRILIGDEVGLGKTVEAIRIIKYLLVTNQAKRILIVAPKNLIKQWLYHDIRDLLYSPRRVKRITRKTIDELYGKTTIGEYDAVVYLAPLDLVKRGSMDKHASGYFKPYYDFISSTTWDLVVVDEAHLLGFTGPRISMRTRRLAPIFESARHIVLLSATPSRGTHEDFLGRLALLVPALRKRLKDISGNTALRGNIYRLLADNVVYRRTKKHVNTIEKREVFTDLSSFMVLIKLGEKRSLYEDLGRIVSVILKSIDQDVPALLKVIVIRRALSSPYAFLKTMSRILSERVDAESRRVSASIISEKHIEEKADYIVERIIRSVIDRIPSSIRQDVLRLIDSFRELHEEGDPSFKALAYLLYNVLMNKQAIPEKLVGDYVVFSEYRDTVEYVYSKLLRFFEDRGFKRDDNIKKDVIERTMNKYYEKKYYERVSEKYANLLREYMEILVDPVSKKYLFIASLSSRNQDIIHLIPELTESIEERVGRDGLKVLISTDIASEGLNLYQFNIVVNYDVPWSPVKREQRIGRVHRLRQRRNCTLLDFVRDTTVDYEFFTELIMKLLNLVEQRIESKPLEGVIELYVATGRGGEEHLRVSEMDVATALCRVYEDYYVHGKDPRNVISGIRAELAKKIKEYKDLSESIETRSVQLDELRDYMKLLTGCDNHQCFEDVVRELYSSITQIPIQEVSRIPIDRVLLDLYTKTSRDYSLMSDSSLIILVRDPSIDKGYLSIIDLVAEGNVKYSMPILVLYRNDKREIKYGLEVVKWIAEHVRNQTIRVARLDKSIETRSRELEEIAYLLRNRFNLLFESRLGKKTSDLARLVGDSSLVRVMALDVVLKPLIIKVLGVQERGEYERYLSTLPAEIRAEMEKKSIEYVKEYFETRGCRAIEVNIGVYKPYDLLVECIEMDKTARYMIEVKSHLKNVFIAELTPAETELAEKNPDKYIVCNVASMENPDKNTWILLCDLYGKLRKQLVTKTKEEKIAILYFTL